MPIALSDSLGLSGMFNGAGVAVTVLAAMALTAALAHALLAGCRRALTRGDLGAVERADVIVRGVRGVVVVLHGVSVLGLGWLSTVRSLLGDWVVVDELACMLPALLVVLATWWSQYPMWRLIRDATLVRALDEGDTIYPPVSRSAYVVHQARHGLAAALTPVLLVLAWGESATRALDAVSGWDNTAGRSVREALNSPASASWTLLAVQLAGLALVLALTPPVLRIVWDTTRLRDGAVRGRLEALCRQAGVRVSQILVWRTHGLVLNGAVLGVIPGLRYILLSDALLDRLSTAQVQAVMAHEVAHVRKAHVVWSILIVLTTLLGLGTLTDVTLTATLAPLADADAGGTPDNLWIGLFTLAASLAGAGSTLVVTLAVFGVVSRRFEWQADAFAAAHLSRHPSDLGEPALMPEDHAERQTPPRVVSSPGAGAMIDALQAVARLNGIPVRARSFRHGSIAERQRRLRALIGQPLDQLPIDRTVRRIKLAAGLALAGMVTTIAFQLR